MKYVALVNIVIRRPLAVLGFLIGVSWIQPACVAQGPPGSLTFAGSAVGREGERPGTAATTL